MSSKIRIGIVGYGNLGRGVEASLQQQADMELVGIFSRRGPAGVEALNPDVPVHLLTDIESFEDHMDVLLLCGGSATDLPEQTPALTRHFHTVDSFDNHAEIPQHFARVDEVAQKSQKIGLISVGWDPGLFSLNRVLADAVLPQGETYTFWGKGLSQGHSDAVRRVEGVAAAVQYTIPSQEAMSLVRQGEQPDLSAFDRHVREVYIVPEDGVDKESLATTIREMPNYFECYETHVYFIDQGTMDRDHQAMPHGGLVIRSGETGEGNPQVMEFGLTLGSNPEFTASALVAYARGVYRMAQMGDYGAKTLYDVAPGWLSPRSMEELRRDFL